MDTTTLKQILQAELEKYTGKGLNDEAYLTVNDSQQLYTVVTIANIREKRIVSTVLVVRLVHQHIIIEVDKHDKTLVDALIARGVPQNQIVRAYAGDIIPA